MLLFRKKKCNFIQRCYIITSKSIQVLHYSSIKINPRKDGNSFYLPHDDLPHMINPIEAKLGM